MLARLSSDQAAMHACLTILGPMDANLPTFASIDPQLKQIFRDFLIDMNGINGSSQVLGQAFIGSARCPRNLLMNPNLLMRCQGADKATVKSALANAASAKGFETQNSVFSEPCVRVYIWIFYDIHGVQYWSAVLR